MLFNINSLRYTQYPPGENFSLQAEVMAPRQKVYRALTDPYQLAKWGVNKSSEKYIGVSANDGSILTMQITNQQPDNIEWRYLPKDGGCLIVNFDIDPQNDGIIIYFSLISWQTTAIFNAIDWQNHLLKLKAYCEASGNVTAASKMEPAA